MLESTCLVDLIAYIELTFLDLQNFKCLVQFGSIMKPRNLTDGFYALCSDIECNIVACNGCYYLFLNIVSVVLLIFKDI